MHTVPLPHSALSPLAGSRPSGSRLLHLHLLRRLFVPSSPGNSDLRAAANRLHCQLHGRRLGLPARHQQLHDKARQQQRAQQGNGDAQLRAEREGGVRVSARAARAMAAAARAAARQDAATAGPQPAATVRAGVAQPAPLCSRAAGSQKRPSAAGVQQRGPPAGAAASSWVAHPGRSVLAKLVVVEHDADEDVDDGHQHHAAAQPPVQAVPGRAARRVGLGAQQVRRQHLRRSGERQGEAG